jgi:nucleoside-diphosphate-sugar epimerase
MAAISRHFSDEASLEAFMAEPSPRVVELMGRLRGDVAVLGAAGKIGVTLCLMAKRAMSAAGSSGRLYAVSRFSDAASRAKLESAGIETISCDLLDEEAVQKLPPAKYVIYLAGRKFGTAGAQELTWAANAVAPANVARKFAGADIVVFSTGCVYDLAAPSSGGASEADDPRPIGEYAQSTLARERIFEYFSGRDGTKACLFRLNYAIDLRYGVLADIAAKVAAGATIDVSVGAFNCIWQGDVIERALLALELCAAPPVALNVTGPETVSVRWAAEEFGRRFGKAPVFTDGAPSPSSERPSGERLPGEPRGYLANAARSFALFGYPAVTLADMIGMVADWVAAGGASLGKPTHFETTNGSY